MRIDTFAMEREVAMVKKLNDNIKRDGQQTIAMIESAGVQASDPRLGKLVDIKA